MLPFHISVANVPAEKAADFLQAAFDGSDAAKDESTKALVAPLVTSALDALKAVPAGQVVSASVVAEIRISTAPAA